MTTSTFTTSSRASSQNASYGDGPRLEPIDVPDSWFVRLAYWFLEWTEGTVITSMKIIRARLPESLRHAWETIKLEEKLSLSVKLRLLLKRYVAQLNGCSFCVDIAEADGQDHGVDVEMLRAVDDYETSDRFSDAERTALAYVKAVTEDVHVNDDVFDRLREHFSEREIVEITWLCATENYYNRLSSPLRIGSDGLCSV